MSALPVLYSFRRCPYAMRARMALLVSGERCILREVVLRNKPADMLAVSPKGTVPVLVLPDGQVIDQSIDIMRWALCRHDPENWLGGDDAELIAENDGAFKYHLDRTKYPERLGSDPSVHREAALEILFRREARLTSNLYLCRNSPALADYATMPFVRQFAAIDRTWFASQALPHLQQWLARLEDGDLFERAMLRLAPWQAGDPPILFG